MATNCIIGIIKADGRVEGITCHWDGHVGGVGQTLVRCYGQYETEKLISLGAISTLGEMVEPPARAKHSFEKPYPGVTVAYQRDRGDILYQGYEGANIEDFLQRVPSTTYTYLLKDEDWFLYIDNDRYGLRLAPALVR